MRRVYYSYGISVVSMPVFWQGVFLGGAAFLLAKWLHVASIVHNFLSVPVGAVPSYVVHSVWGAMTHGELLTVVVLCAAAALLISASVQLVHALFGLQQLRIRL